MCEDYERLPLGAPLIGAPAERATAWPRLGSEARAGCEGIVEELVGGGGGTNTGQRTTPALDLTEEYKFSLDQSGLYIWDTEMHQ